MLVSRRMWWIIVLCYAGAHYLGTHTPIDPVPHSTVPIDKWLHFGSYTGLAGLVGMGLCPTWRERMLAIITMMLWAGFDELTQPYVGRHAEWADWYADVRGIFLGMILATAVLQILSLRNPRQPEEYQGPG